MERAVKDVERGNKEVKDIGPKDSRDPKVSDKTNK